MVAASATVQVWFAPSVMAAERSIAAGAPVWTLIPAVLSAGVMVSVPDAPEAMLTEESGPTPTSLMKGLGMGDGYRYAHDEPDAFAAGARYLPEGVEQRFVSLPVGIPLDTMEPLPTNSRNADFAAFQAARNNLHDQFMAVAAKLQPGEEKIIGLGDSGLALQIRRVNEEAAPIAAGNNPFVAALSFG